ncbi:MAG: hypothetical protein JSR77_18045 [Planctomycetes bacterium]|nr:hypothetical protein [Planctomycetota bacterium]
MKSAASIISFLALLAGVAHAQPAIPVADRQSARILTELGVVQATLPPEWGQLRTDIKGGNPMQMVVPGGETLWSPDTVQPLNVPDGTLPAETLIEVDLGGMAVTLRLHPQALQGHDPVVMVQLPDGSLERFYQLPSNLYAGEVDGFPNSSVSASFRNGKLRALVQLTPDVAWEIQPLSDLTTGGDPRLHMAWDSSRPVPGPQGRCGVVDGPDHPPAHDQGFVPKPPLPGQAHTMTIDQIADEGVGQPGGSDGGGGSGGGYAPRASWDSLLAVDVDCYLYNNYNNVQDTIDFVYEVINASNTRYTQHFGFRHLVTHILVRTSCNNDPYQTSNPDSADQMLLAMRDNVWNAANPVPRNQAMLFTGRNLDGATVGLAYLGSACSGADGGHLLIEADWNFQSQMRYLVSKHELGHTWNATHTCDQFGTSGYCSIMCATIDDVSCGTVNSDFMPLSISQIGAFHSTATCNAHQGSIWYADARNPYAFPNGNQNHPYLEFLDAYNNALNGQTVFVKGYGVQDEYVAPFNQVTRLTRPMTITGNSAAGPARIR